MPRIVNDTASIRFMVIVMETTGTARVATRLDVIARIQTRKQSPLRQRLFTGALRVGIFPPVQGHFRAMPVSNLTPEERGFPLLLYGSFLWSIGVFDLSDRAERLLHWTWQRLKDESLLCAT